MNRMFALRPGVRAAAERIDHVCASLLRVKVGCTVSRDKSFELLRASAGKRTLILRIFRTRVVLEVEWKRTYTLFLRICYRLAREPARARHGDRRVSAHPAIPSGLSPNRWREPPTPLRGLTAVRPSVEKARSWGEA
jgi:hypothetical protein